MKNKYGAVFFTIYEEQVYEIFIFNFFACLVFETGHLKSKSISKEDNNLEKKKLFEKINKKDQN